MTRRPRRPTGGVHDPARATEAVEAAFLRFEGRFDEFTEGVFARFNRLEEDVRSGALRTERLAAEQAELRRDAGEVRDGVAQLRQELESLKVDTPREVAAGAAQGAAQGAAVAAKEAVAPEVASEVVKRLWSHWLSRLGAAGVAIVIFLAVVKEAGPVARAVEAFARGPLASAWTWLKSL